MKARHEQLVRTIGDAERQALELYRTGANVTATIQRLREAKREIEERIAFMARSEPRDAEPRDAEPKPAGRRRGKTE